MGEFALGRSVPRFEDARLLRGGGHYIDDLIIPGMAYGVVLRARHAHAKILGIDTSRAVQAPGVLKIMTHDTSFHVRTAAKGATDHPFTARRYQA